MTSRKGRAYQDIYLAALYYLKRHQIEIHNMVRDKPKYRAHHCGANLKPKILSNGQFQFKKNKKE